MNTLTIGDSVFENCNNIKNVDICGSKKDVTNVLNQMNLDKKNVKLKVTIVKLKFGLVIGI